MLDLISIIRSQKPLSSADIRERQKSRMPSYSEETKEQTAEKLKNLQEHENPLWFLSGQTDEVREFLRQHDNNLDFQVETVKRCFVAYFLYGETPPPYYPFRIAVILRKAGLHSVEKSFLEAWVSHFPGGGGKYDALSNRLRKILAVGEHVSGCNP